jgi:predicted ATPase
MPKPRQMAGEPQVDVRVPFVGRAAEIQRLLVFFSAGGALTIVGPGGVGKSRLALEAARRLSAENGRPVIFAGLAGVTPEAVTGTVVACAGLREKPHVNAIDALRAHLRAKRAILVLDNCEHVPDETSALIDALHAEPSVAILATSQRRLDYTDEIVLRLDPFPVDDGVRFFVARARLEAPTHAVLGDVGTIVSRLDGLAIALDLAAARLTSLSMRELANELATLRPYDLRSTRGADARHRTIGNVIAWSHSQLSDLAKRAFAFCSLFSGTFDASDAAALLAETESPERVRGALEELARHSLVTEQRRGYAMLLPIRAVAGRMLAQIADRRRSDGRFAAHMNALAVELRARIETRKDGESAVRELSARYGDFCKALNWALKRPVQRFQVVIDVATSLAALWADGGRMQEGLVWTERFDAVTSRLPAEVRGKIHYLSLRVAHAACNYERMLAVGSPAISAFTIAGDRLGLARAYNGMAVAALYTGRLEQAETCVHTAIALYRALGHERGQASALVNEGNIALEGRSDCDAARDYYLQSIAILERTGSDPLAGISYGNLAEAEYHRGDLDACERAAFAAIEHFRRSQSVPMIGWQEQLLACVDFSRGRALGAKRHLRVALELLQSSPHPLYIALSAETAARILLNEGRIADAVLALQAARRIRRERSLAATGPGARLARIDAERIEGRLDRHALSEAAAHVEAWDEARLPEALGLLVSSPTMVGAGRGEELL